MAYAEGTTVPVEKTKTELDVLLGKHGATQRGSFTDDTKGVAVVLFQLDGRKYQILVPLPQAHDVMPSKTKDEPRGWNGWDAKKRQAWVSKTFDQRSRERWRAVLLLCKAKLELVALGVSSVEREFLADLVLPTGERVHDAVAKNIQTYYVNGTPPTRLLGS